MRERKLAAAAIAAMALVAWPAATASAQIRIQFIAPEERVADLFAAHDFAGAAAYIDDQLDRRPADAQMLYCSACARARLGESDSASDLLMRAVKAGFNDFSRMRRDEHLIPIRDHRVFEALVAALGAADDLIARRQLDLCLEQIDQSNYAIDRDSLPGMAMVTARDAADNAELPALIRAQLNVVSGVVFDGAAIGHRINVIIPAAEDARVLLGRSHAGGVYRHNQRTLIALDTGLCLRHELVHALHHSEMDRLGQQHPLWIEEGLALLLEEHDIENGAIVFPSTQRDNFARIMLREDRLIPWSQLLTDDEMVRGDPARSYAQLRSMMRYLHDRVDIGRWYAAYVESFDDDPRGTIALERASGVSLVELEAQWRQWLADQSVTVARGRPPTPVPEREPSETFSQPKQVGTDAAAGSAAEPSLTIGPLPPLRW